MKNKSFRIGDRVKVIDNEFPEMKKLTYTVVEFGNDTIIIEDVNGKQTEYRITGSQEANPMERKLSDDSPFGRAIVGKAAGDTFVVNAPAGSFTMKVVSVSREG